MKKTLLVILCLSISTLAQGAIWFAPSKTTVARGETITIRLIANGPSYGFNLEAVSDGAKGGFASNLVFGSGLTPVSPGYIENMPDGLLFDYASAYAAGGAVPAGDFLFRFDYTADSILGPVTIAPLPADIIILRDGVQYVVGPSTGDVGGVVQPVTGCTITVVPEPMTVAMLGLGAMLLRRRIA